jgi:transcriptional regulator with XRE-family HTH domain
MDQMTLLGKQIRNRRLALNLRMDDVAKEAGISRATLSSIENGKCNCSAYSLFNVMRVLGLSVSLNEYRTYRNHRNRASRTNTAMDKRINRFVIMCVEQFAESINKSSDKVYKLLKEKKIIDELINDYEDLHGMSTVYLNDYINALIGARS